MEETLLNLAFELERLALWPLCAFAFVLYYRRRDMPTLVIFVGMATMAITQLDVYSHIIYYVLGSSEIKKSFQEFMLFHFLLRASFLIGLLLLVIGSGWFAFRIKNANAD